MDSNLRSYIVLIVVFVEASGEMCNDSNTNCKCYKPYDAFHQTPVKSLVIPCMVSPSRYEVRIVSGVWGRIISSRSVLDSGGREVDGVGRESPGNLCLET